MSGPATGGPGGPGPAAPGGGAPEVDAEIQVSTRDDDDLRARLRRWLAGRLSAPSGGPDGGAHDVEIGALVRPSTNGMSSDTVLFDATWTRGDSERAAASLVARIAPTDDAFPVFPTYDLGAQAQVMRLVAERSDVPVPPMRWFEPEPDHVGGPFLVMDRVDGRVPPDVAPYTIGSWLSEASDAERAALQSASVGVLAGVHAAEASPADLAFLDPGTEGDTPLRRHVAAARAYHRWTCAGMHTPLLDRAFGWLEEHWPAAAEAEPPVLCWGDARIGNIIYRDFTPVAVLDWEMASPGPRELDLGWMIFFHRFFQDLTEELGLPGLPTFLDRDAVAHEYALRTGHEPRDLDWFITYAAARHGVIMTRVMGRQVHFGEREPPDDPEEHILHRATLTRLLDGTYWDR